MLADVEPLIMRDLFFLFSFRAGLRTNVSGSREAKQTAKRRCRERTRDYAEGAQDN